MTDTGTVETRALLTVILAAKEPDARQLNACIASVAALRMAQRIHITIVASGPLPGVHHQYASDVHGITVVETEPRGVYSAFNRGLDGPLGEYVLFLGVDDLVLPGLDRVLASLGQSPERPALIACQAWMQDRGLSGPSQLRGALIFRNWCQQALLYHSSVFATRRFDPKYRVQADHQLNLELVGSRQTMACRDDVITHFASGGLTSQVVDWPFRADMPAIVRRWYGPFYWLLALGRRSAANLIKGRRAPSP